jgi:hypothetical protein
VNQKTLQRRQHVLGTEHAETLNTMDLLGLVRIAREEYGLAETVLGECLEKRAKALPDHWSRFHTESLLGGCLIGQKKYAEAETHLLSAYRGMKDREKTMSPALKPRLSEAAGRLIRLYDAWGKMSQAEEWRRKRSPIPDSVELPADPIAGL